MKWMDFVWKGIVLLLIGVGVVLGSRSLVFGQGTDQEPNDTCETAQDVGEVMLPFTLSGSLDATPTTGDIDFFRFSGEPGAQVRAVLAGQGTGQGTLGDPLLGLFDADCNLIASDDDSGGNLNARLLFAIPASGTFILAATSSPDFGFIGNTGVGGSYELSISSVVLAGAISGRVVDANTGEPLPGDVEPFAIAELYRCTDGECFEFVASQPTGSDGRFRFEQDFSGNPLTADRYQVRVAAFLYELAQIDPFDLDEGADVDLGDIPLMPTPGAGAISGRVVDAGSGEPLPGNIAPFAFVELYRCFDGGCFEFVASQPTDSEGRFRFARNTMAYPPPVGTYQIVASANEYQRGETEPFEVGEGEEIDVGDIALEPLPIQFSEIRPCGALPPEGGLCRYSVRVTNRSNTTIDGAVWSIVNSFGIGSLTDFTVFQPDEPHEVRLDPGQSMVVRFRFRVPPGVRDGTYVCAQAFFGQEPINPFFNTIGYKNLFCILKGYTGEFVLVAEKEAQQMMRRLDQPAQPPPPEPGR